MALLGVTAIRLALMAGGVGAAIAVGATGRSAGIGCALGVVGGAFFVLADPRRKLVSAQAKPPGRPWWQRALIATFPSTIGLAVLCGIGLAFNGVLAAVLAGVIGGLGVGGLVAALGWP